MRLNKKSIFRVFIVLSSMIVSIYMYNNTMSYGLYKNYFFVPLFYGICISFLSKIDFFNFRFPGAIILNYTTIIKYLIMPFIMCLGNYYSWLGTMPSEKNINYAIILTIIEMISVLLVSNYISKKEIIVEKERHNIKPLKSGFIHIIFIVLGFVAFMLVPKAFEDYRFIFDTNDLATTIKVDFEFSGIYKTLFIFARYSLIILLINYFYKRNLRKKSKFNILMSFVPVFLNCLYISNLSRINICVPLFTFSILIFLLFNEKSEQKLIIRLLLITLISSIVFMSALKFFGEGRGNEGKENDIAWWGDTLNMYFSGPKETAIGVKANDLIESEYGWKRYNLLINDTFSNVIGLSNFTTKNNSTTLYNYVYFSSTVAICQIVPNIIEGYYYFGFLFCFIWPVLFVFLCYYFNKKAQIAETLDLKFAYLYSSIYCGMVLMINSTMLIGNIINITLLFAIISAINNKIIMKRSCQNEQKEI